MTYVIVTLVYADGSTWLAGQFEGQDAATAWITAEQAKPYWKSTTTVQQQTIVVTPQTNGSST